MTTIPPPTPVPMMTPNTTRAPRPAPATASASAKQFASFSTTTRRPSRCSRSPGKSCSFRHTVLQFFIRPVRLGHRPRCPDTNRSRVPGVDEQLLCKPAQAFENVRVPTLALRGDSAPHHRSTVLVQHHPLNLRPTKVNPDAPRTLLRHADIEPPRPRLNQPVDSKQGDLWPLGVCLAIHATFDPVVSNLFGQPTKKEAKEFQMSNESGRVALVLLVLQAGLVIAATNIFLYIDAVQHLPPHVTADSLRRALEDAMAHRPMHVIYLIAVPIAATLMVAFAVALRRDRPPTAGLAPKPAPETAPSKPSNDPALRLLTILQSEGRFIDFIQESLEPYADAQVGAAVRSIHDGCRQALSDRITIERIYTEEEGSEIEIPPGFDSASVRLTGNLQGNPPFRGTLQHGGWRVTQVNLPEVSGEVDVTVLAPAEVEIP